MKPVLSLPYARFDHLAETGIEFGTDRGLMTTGMFVVGSRFWIVTLFGFCVVGLDDLLVAGEWEVEMSWIGMYVEGG